MLLAWFERQIPSMFGKAYSLGGGNGGNRRIRRRG